MIVKTSKSNSTDMFQSGFEPDKTNGVSVVFASQDNKSLLRLSPLEKSVYSLQGDKLKHLGICRYQN